MKRLAITDSITRLLKKQLGDDADVSRYAVFVAIALNALPLRKKHFLYEGATVDKNILEEMARGLETESIPLRLEHFDDDLPAGRVFTGTVNETLMGPELRVLFWVDETNEEALKKVENGTVDQVSVGFMSKQILCNKCEFDYLGEDVDLDALFSGTCENGHTLGKDGCHAVLKGLDAWFELSLVGRGGAQNARILRRDQSKFAETNVQALAANGVDPNFLVINASITKDDNMTDLTKIINEITELKMNASKFETDKAALEAKIADLEAKNKVATDRVAELEATSTELDELKAELKESKTEGEGYRDQIAALTTSVKDVATALLAKSGDVKASALEGKESAEDILAVIGDAKLQLGKGGVGREAASDSLDKPSVLSGIGAFRSNSSKR